MTTAQLPLRARRGQAAGQPGLARARRSAAWPGTLGPLLVTASSTIVVPGGPGILAGIGLGPVRSGAPGYLLGLLLSFPVAGAVLAVPLGRLGDRLGRVRLCELGLALFTASSVLLSVTWLTGTAGAQWLIGWRLVQGAGGACLMAGATAVVTDAFPDGRRGAALGGNAAAAAAGSFLGLLLGAALAPHDWRLAFIGPAAPGLLAWAWARRTRRGAGRAGPYPAAGPRSSPARRRRGLPGDWTASLLTSLSWGGLQLIVLSWLLVALPAPGGSPWRAVWWLLPAAGGVLLSAPLAGALADRSGARLLTAGGPLLTAGGPLLAALALGLLRLSPARASDWKSALVLGLYGVGTGMIAAPGQAAAMGRVPAERRGAAAGWSTAVAIATSALVAAVFCALLAAAGPRSWPSAWSAGAVRPVGKASGLARAGSFPPFASGPFHDALLVTFWCSIGASVAAAAVAVLAARTRRERPAGPAAVRAEPAGAGEAERGARPGAGADPHARAGDAAPGPADRPPFPAADETAIAGLVTGPDGAPAAGVTVSALNAAHQVAAAAVTGPDGRYLLTAPGPGDYVLIAAGWRAAPAPADPLVTGDAPVRLRIEERP